MKRILVLVVSLSLLFSCSGDKVVPELPPPVIEKEDPAPTPGGDEEGGEEGKDDPPPVKDHDPVYPGSAWTKHELSEGLIYYVFNGKDDITGANQICNVISVDLKNPRYQVKYFHQTKTICSDVLASKGAVASMNATYEQASIYAKVEGAVKCIMENNNISDTGVPNWKNEGCVCTDGNRNITFYQNTSYGQSIPTQRNFFSSLTEKNIFSSAPLLIYNYEQLGSTFITRMPGYKSGINLNSLNSEDPIRHQGVRHPRTVAALTADGRFLMFTVDGRTTYSAGMNAKELTAFLVKHFDPKFALNMDGGGSTTMCVKGYGDPTTNVVNYPCDNGGHDHDGQRSVPTHFYIIDTK